MVIDRILAYVARSAMLAAAVHLSIACGGGGVSRTPVNPPAAPVGVTATGGDGEISVSWEPSASATGYRVLRAGTSGGPYALVASPSGTSYLDGGLANGATYFYVVRAVNAAGESADSAEVSATPAAPPPPDPPSGLTATGDDGKVSLAWSASARATSYEVQRDAGCTASFVAVATPTDTAYLDTGLANGTQYCYRVRARNASGWSAPSNVASATPRVPPPPGAPTPPTGVSATWGNGEVELAWTASALATGYSVRRSLGAGGPYTEVAAVTATSYTDTTVVNGTTYFYVILATNAAGESWPSQEVSATPSSGREICVANLLTHNIAVLDGAGSGDMAPLRRLGNVTGFDVAHAIAIDRVHGEIYVTNEGQDSGTFYEGFRTGYAVTVHARTADGNVPPVRVIAGPATGLDAARAVAVDPVHDEVFVEWDGIIRVYSRTANGDVAPIRSLTVKSGCTPVALDVDPIHDELFVGANCPSGHVLTYARTAQGTSPPLIRDVYDATSHVSTVVSVVYDEVHDELVLAAPNGAVVIFLRTDGLASSPGEIPRKWMLTGLAGTKWADVDDSTGNIHIATARSIGVFSRPTANGSASPVRTIAGAATGLVDVSSIGLDPANGELFAANGPRRKLVAHASSGDGDVTPLRTLSGTASGMLYPSGVAAAPIAGKLFVSNAMGPSITSYPMPWTGLPAPSTTVSGDATDLDFPTGIAVDETHGEVFVSNMPKSRFVPVFPFAADGNAAYSRGLLTPLGGIAMYPIAADGVHGEIFVARDGNVYTLDPAKESGNTKRTLGPLPNLATAIGISYDPVYDELVLLAHGNTGSSELMFFSRTAVGAATPRTAIGGPATGMAASPKGLATVTAVLADAAHGEVFVAREDGAVLVFSRTATGNVAPLRTISGPSTTLVRPSGIAACR